MGKNSLNNIICYLSWLEKLSPTHTHPLISIREFLKPYELLFFELRVTHKKLNVNFSTWITHPPTPTWPTQPLHDPPHHTPAWHTPPHLYMTHPTPLLHDPPTTPLHDPPHPIKWNFMKIHSIILSVTCHSLRNFLPLTHIPLYPLMNFWNLMGWSGSYMGGVG